MSDSYKTSTLFHENYYTEAHTVINQGGSGSGKTYAIIQVLFCIACENAGMVITVVSQDIPNLKAGAIRDALTIHAESEQFSRSVKSYNKSDRVFEFNNGSIIEFKSYDDGQDAKSGKRDYLFVNEANGIIWDIYSELALRTRKRIYIDFNPNYSFWVHDNLVGKPGVQLIISDHRHNPFLKDEMRDRIESLKEIDKERWKVYARGVTGKIAGLVFNNWHVCHKVPEDAKLIAVGLDFGYSTDPSACLEVYKQNGELWINQLFYEKELTNQDISRRLKETQVNKTTEIIADCSEPKSIEELSRLGWYISPAKKGADSIKHSIDILQRYRLNITQQSIDLRYELERYKWRVSNTGKMINTPVDNNNHLIDALRYVALNKLKTNTSGQVKTRLPHTHQFLKRDILNEMITSKY